MNFWYKGHHYRTQFRHSISMFSHWWSLKGFLKAAWNGQKYFIWISHEGDCCDYWTPISDPRAQRALMLDDDLGLVKEQSNAKN